MNTSCKLMSPTQILAICQNIYEGTHKIVILSDWMESPARVNIKQPWQQVISVTLLGYAWCGFKTVYSRGLIPSGSPIVDVLRYVSESSFESIRMGTALARIRESFHTMLSTISNSEPVSTGWFIANCFHAATYGDRELTTTTIFINNFHMLIRTTWRKMKLVKVQKKVLIKRSKQSKVQKDSMSKSKNLQNWMTYEEN